MLMKWKQFKSVKNMVRIETANTHSPDIWAVTLLYTLHIAREQNKAYILNFPQEQ